MESLLGAVGAAGLAALEHAPERLREQADELLSRPPYSEHDDGLITRALSWLGDQIAALFGDGLNAVFGVPFVPYLIAFVGLVLLLLAAWRMTRGMIVDRAVPVVPREATTRTAHHWLTEAEGHLSAGRRREALRCRYAALVVALVDAGVVDDIPGRTVRELSEAVRSNAAKLASTTQAASKSFEQVLYGRTEASDEDLEVVTAAVAAAMAAPVAVVAAADERA